MLSLSLFSLSVMMSGVGSSSSRCLQRTLKCLGRERILVWYSDSEFSGMRRFCMLRSFRVVSLGCVILRRAWMCIASCGGGGSVSVSVSVSVYMSVSVSVFVFVSEFVSVYVWVFVLGVGVDGGGSCQRLFSSSLSSLAVSSSSS